MYMPSACCLHQPGVSGIRATENDGCNYSAIEFPPYAGGYSSGIVHASRHRMALGSNIVDRFHPVGNRRLSNCPGAFRPPPVRAPDLPVEVGEGFGFSLAGSTQSAYNDIDKTMLSHYGMNVANGIYTMAYRIVDVATIPITALDAAALPRFFRQSRDGATSVADLSVRLAKRAVLLGIIMSGCLFLTAPLIPLIVGNGFRDSVMALRWLCLIPAFRGIHQITGSAITGMGFQRYRTSAQFSAAALNLGLNLWLIPRYGWLGAAWASVATDGALGVTNWSMLQCLKRRA